VGSVDSAKCARVPATLAFIPRRFVMKTLDIVAAILLVVGGLNWGLWGAFEFDLVATIFGGSTAVLAKLVYVVVGFAAVYQIVSLKAIQTRWHVRSATA
jgi:uncharacterized membrane protein YuzA (DUF378 family)